MDAADVDLAAHVDCTIAHSFADLGYTIGLGLGIIAGIAIVIGGRSAPAVKLATWVAGKSADLGGWIGEQFTSEDSGRIARGSPTTFYGPQLRAAARMDDRTACHSPGGAFLDAIPILGDIRRGWRGIRNLWDEHVNGIEVLPADYAPGAHPQSKIADGSRTVSIDQFPAARKGDGVAPCDGKISSGIESIKIGGPRGQAAGTADRSEVDPAMRGVAFALEGIGAAAGGPLDFGLWVASQSSDPRVAAAADLVGDIRSARDLVRRSPDQLGDIVDVASDGASAVDLATNAPGHVRDAATALAPAPQETVFDPRTRRWVRPPPPPRAF